METVPRNRFTPGLTFFVTISVKAQKPIFVEEAASELVFETLQFFRKNGELDLYGFVIMPDHVHLLVKLRGSLLLPIFARRFKSYVAKNLSIGPIWEKGYWSKVISNQKGAWEALRYIHLNPVKGLLVHEAEDFCWSSARDYLAPEHSTRVDFWWGDASR